MQKEGMITEPGKTGQKKRERRGMRTQEELKEHKNNKKSREE